jgi:hypothetical protein
LRNLLYSLSLFERQSRVIVHDLGLAPGERQQLIEAGWEVRGFPFEAYPPHVDIRVNRGQYAWKPIIIADGLKEVAGMVLWLDAGNLVLGPLDNVRRRLLTDGVYSPRSGGDVARWTHPGTLRFLGASSELLDKPNRTGGLVGFNAGYPGVTELVERWRQCALEPDCIAPFGSDRTNHRQDQAVLTVLLYQFQARQGCHLEEARLDNVTTHNDRLTETEVRELLTRTISPPPPSSTIRAPR